MKGLKRDHEDGWWVVWTGNVSLGGRRKHTSVIVGDEWASHKGGPDDAMMMLCWTLLSSAILGIVLRRRRNTSSRQSGSKEEEEIQGRMQSREYV